MIDFKASSANDKSKDIVAPVVAITPGEPAGIGPDLAVLVAQTPCAYTRVFIADPNLLEARAKLLGVPFRAVDYLQSPNAALAEGEAYVYPVSLAAPALPGELDPKNAAYVLKTLDVAIDGCLSQEFSEIGRASCRERV